MTQPTPSHYTGRFAPSPSGPLHFGSLIAALGSYLRARQSNGRWLLRIEDIDPPREMADADQLIMETLHAHGLEWDDSVSYQSQHHARYEQVLAALLDEGVAYYCQCTRAQVRAAGGRYPGTCRAKHLSSEGCALRFANHRMDAHFDDGHFGPVEVAHAFVGEDYIIRRKDGLYAYHLAVVVDDIEAGITEIVRGADLLDTTVSQMALYNALQKQPPHYWHLPVASLTEGRKLSKQNHAPALDSKRAVDNLRAALTFLGLESAVVGDCASPQSMLEEAIRHWRPEALAKTREILVTDSHFTDSVI